MRPTLRLLNAATHAHDALRARTTGFVGLGRMGYEMAYNLFSRTLVETNGAAQFVVCDAREDTTNAFVKNFNNHFPGAKVDVLTSPADVVRAAQTVVTMLPSSPHVRQVYTEAGGIIAALRSLPPEDVSPTFCIDSTTLDVAVAREVSQNFHEAGASMIDAPVSGGVAGAKAGTLSFMVGGTEDEFRRAAPILSHMGKKIIHCGSSGAGLAAKICNNLVLGIQQIAVGEAMVLGQRFGLDPATLANVINSSTGACWASSVNNPVPGALVDKEPPCTRDYEGGFATNLMLKDMELAVMPDENKPTLPLGSVATLLYQKAVEVAPELGNKDFSSIYRVLEKWSRVPLGEVLLASTRADEKKP